MPTPDRRDPHGNHGFLVEIDGIAVAGFSRVSMPASRADALEYREGNDLGPDRKLLGAVHHDDLVLARGVRGESLELYEWWKQVEDGKIDEARRNVAVILQDGTRNEVARWTFENAWPVRYEVTDLHGDGGAVAEEVLEVAHEGMRRVA